MEAYYTFVAYLFYNLGDDTYQVESVRALGVNSGTVRPDIEREILYAPMGHMPHVTLERRILCARPFSTKELVSPNPSEPISKELAIRWINLMTSGPKPRAYEI